MSDTRTHSHYVAVDKAGTGHFDALCPDLGEVDCEGDFDNAWPCATCMRLGSTPIKSLLDADDPLMRKAQARVAAAGRPKMTNRYAGPCARCGSQLKVGEGELLKEGGGWIVRCHPRCPEGVTSSAAAEASRVDPDAGLFPNRYGGACGRCNNYVAPSAGLVRRVGSSWEPIHRHGQCPEHVERVAGEEGHVYFDDQGRYVLVRPNRESGRLNGYAFNPDTERFEWEFGLLDRLVRELTVEEAIAFGHEYVTCCFCGRHLETDESKAAGYGPKCAATRGLRWGTVE